MQMDTIPVNKPQPREMPPKNLNKRQTLDESLSALVSFITAQNQKTSLVIVLVYGCLGFIVHHRLPPGTALFWFVSGCLLLLARAWVFKRIQATNDFQSPQRLQQLIAFSLANGLFMATAVVAFPWLSIAERSFLTVFVLGLCAGAVGTTMGYNKLLWTYAGPIFFALTLGWVLSPHEPLAEGQSNSPQWIEDAIAAIMLLFAMVLQGLAKETYRNFNSARESAQQALALNQQLNASLEELQLSNSAKIRFLAAASHDLRQPVHAQSMLIATLQMRALDAKSQQIVSILQSSSQSLGALLESLLDISKLDAGLVTPNWSDVNLNSLLQRCFDSSKTPIEQAGLQALIQTREEVTVSSDPEIVLRVLRNLVDNAIKFTPQGFIRFEQGLRHGRGYLAITDSGIGIPTELQESVFQEFFQVGNYERDRSKGLGLGLSIVKRLCQIINVQLTMTSSASGTKFELIFNNDQSMKGESMSAIQVQDQDHFTGLEVLIVDDEADVRRSMGFLLEELGCHPHETQSTSEVALKVQHFRPDLMLADFRLKNHDSGIASIAALRERWPGVPAVLVSGDTAPERLLEAQAAGVRILHKPLALDALRNELAQAWKLKQTLVTQTSTLQA
jgi:signal transduction histidine kinase/ActR/RegA family two-component response regulator